MRFPKWFPLPVRVQTKTNSCLAILLLPLPFRHRAPRVQHDVPHACNTMLANIKNSITGTYRAAHEKHAQRRLAEFEYRLQ